MRKNCTNEIRDRCTEKECSTWVASRKHVEEVVDIPEHRCADPGKDMAWARSIERRIAEEGSNHIVWNHNQTNDGDTEHYQQRIIY